MAIAENVHIPSHVMQLRKLVGKVVKIQFKRENSGITGLLLSISDRFIELQHLDGRTSLIKISEIVLISPIKGKEGV